MNSMNKIIDDIAESFAKRFPYWTDDDIGFALAALNRIRDATIEEIRTALGKIKTAPMNGDYNHEWIDTCDVWKSLAQLKGKEPVSNPNEMK